MTRKIFRELSRRNKVQLVCWNDIGRSYQQLSAQDRQFVERPFEVSSRATSRPDLSGTNFLNAMYRLLTRPRIALEKKLTEHDVFFVPDSFHNRRRTFLPKLLDRTGARKVAIFHDAANLRLSNLFRDRGNKVRAYIESLSVFDLVVCVSREAEDDLHRFWKEYGCAAAKTVVEPWPADDRSSMETGNAASKIVVYVSSLAGRKNHLTLLRAAEHLWEGGCSFELWLIGRNARSFNKVVKEIRAVQKRKWPLRWLRHVNEETLLRVYRECRFTVYPSLLEGFGLPIMESLLHGKPCICGSNGALGEIARGGGCLIVDQTNEEALATAIQDLLRDDKLYAQLSADARARTFRTWSDYIQRLREHLGDSRSSSTLGRYHTGSPRVAAND